MGLSITCPEKWPSGVCPLKTLQKAYLDMVRRLCLLLALAFAGCHLGL